MNEKQFEPFNELQVFRQSNPKPDRQRLVTGIVDRRLKQFAKLQTKQQILQECQQLIINKLLDFMNQLDIADIKYLKQTQLYTQKLQAKEDIIIQLQKSQNISRNQIKLKSQEIERLIKQVENMKLKISHLQDQNQSIINYQKNDQTTITNYKTMIKQLQDENYIIQKNNVVLKQQLIYLNQVIQVKTQQIDTMTIQIKNHQALKTLNLNQDTKKMNSSFKRKASKKKQNRHQQQFNKSDKIIEVSPLENVKLSQKSMKKIKSLNLTIFKLDSIKLGQMVKQQIPIKKQSKKKLEFNLISQNEIVKSQKFKSQKNTISKYQSPLESMLSIKSSVKMIPTTVIIDSFTIPAQRHSIFNKTQIQQQLKQKQNNKDNKDLLQWKQQFKKQSVEAFNDMYRLANDIKKISNQRINLLLAQKQQIQQMLKNMPSKEQDLYKIMELTNKNQQLRIIVKQAQQSAQSAYQAMRITKQQLKRVLQHIPFEIYNTNFGRPAPKMNVQVSNRRSRSGQRVSMHTTIKKQNSTIILGNSSNLTPKLIQKKKSHAFAKHDLNSEVDFKQIIGQGQMNLNTYVKYQQHFTTNNPKQGRKRCIKSAFN